MRFKPLSPWLDHFVSGITSDGLKWMQRLADLITYTRAFTFACGTTSITANTTVEVTYTVAGLFADDVVTVNPASTMPTGVGIVGAYVSATDTLKVRYMNTTAGNLPLVAATYTVLATRF